jgi:anaerobic selenocysteine-containing dehydrogenase
MTRTTHLGACPLDCPDTCTWQLTVEDGRAVAIAGDREHPFTRGSLCGKVNRYLDAVNGPDRLTEPLIRVGPKGVGAMSFRPATWDEAIGMVAAGLQATIDQDGPEAILPYYFAGTMGHVQGWTMGPRLFAHLGASRLETTICTGAAKAALRSLYGGSVGFEPESVVDAKLILLWGANLISANLHQWPFVLEARARGAPHCDDRPSAHGHRGSQRRTHRPTSWHRRRFGAGPHAARPRGRGGRPGLA